MAKNNNSRSQRKKNRKHSSQESSWRTWIKRFLVGSGLILLLGLIAGGGLFTYYAASAPELTEEDLYGSYTSELVDQNGDVFYTLGGRNREHASFEEYPQVLEDAVLAIEDQRFYDHNGVDPIGIARAAAGLVANQEIVGGGSTITQQLVKLSVFSTTEEDQTFERKAQEAWLATQVENDLSKEEILNLYFNKVHMGGNIYGMATAAEEFYGKPVSELELHEAALIAGMPAAPNYYDPFENPNEAKNRRDTVLYSMVDYGAITEQQAQQAYQVPVQEGLQEPSNQQDQNSIIFDGYITTVLEEVTEKTGLDPYTAGLTIHTNLDSEAQELLYDVTHNQDIVEYPNEELQTASSVINNDNGAILATLGGRHIEGHLSNNRATNLRRGVGSAIKPLTTYGPAIEYNQYSTHHQVVDEEYVVPGTNWELANYDNEYHGQMSMREALVDSRNIPTAKIFNEDLDWNNVEGFLSNLGVDPNNISAGGGLVPSSAIDGIMTPMQLAGAYSAFANGGTYTEPHAVHTVVTQDGEEIDLTPESNQAMSDYTAYMITDMLKGVVDDYASLEVPGLNHAGKTGTTNYTADQHQEHNIPENGVPDSWFAGYTPNITMSVWAGYDQPYEQGNYLTNDDGTRQIPRLVYQAFMEQYTEGQENPDWQQPNSVVEEEVVAGSDPAVRASSSTSGETVTELFVRGNEPQDAPEPQEDESENESNEDSQNEQDDQNTQDNQGEQDEENSQEDQEQDQQSGEATPAPDSSTESEEDSADGGQENEQDTSPEEDTGDTNNGQEATSGDQDDTSNEEDTESPTPEDGDDGQDPSGGNQEDGQSGSNEEQSESDDQGGSAGESSSPSENEGNGQGSGSPGGNQENGESGSNNEESDSGDQGGNSGQSSGEQPGGNGQGDSSESSTQQNGNDGQDSPAQSSPQQNGDNDQENNGTQNESSGEESTGSNAEEQTEQTPSGDTEENDQ